ncbi:MAG: hypothetical protein JOZ69_03035 [Myxococcales bacterium]|nr:hypothetical protein [Myxococcales bacterium]
MRPYCPLAFVLAFSSCGGASGEGAGRPEAKAAAAGDESDPGFADYAATHGIATLDHPEEAPPVSAEGLRLESLERGKAIKLDGVLNEWPAPARATEAVKGSTKSTLAIALQYDAGHLYVGADVGDAAFAVGKDHVDLTLAVPRPGGAGRYAVYELGLYAGKPGESEGSVRLGQHGSVPGAKIVEAPTDLGYSFEAQIPLGAIPEMKSTRVGIHGRAAYVDGDAVIATGPGDAQHPAAMAWVPSEPELSLVEQLLAPKGLTRIAPAADIVADLTGDGARERIAVFEHYLTICGSSYLGGTGFFYRDLVGELVKLEVRDVTGRGRGDVVVRRRQSSGDGTREYLEVLSAPSNTEEPRLTFAHEVGIRQSDRHLENAVRLAHGEIDVTVEPATGWDAGSYAEPIATDVEPVLLPWGNVKSQTFRFDGTHFAKAHVVTQEPTAPPPGSPGAAAAAERGADEPLRRGSFPRPPEPPTPKVSRGGDLSAQVLEQYRRDRGASGAVSPRADLQVNVAGDERPERVLLIGRDIVVLGPGFKDGASYTFLTLQQFADAGDIHDLSARDLTGDGAADLVVRGVRRVTAGKANVEVEMLFVYQVKDDAIARVFGIETSRELKGKRVQGLVQFIPAPDGKSFQILAAPGRAHGWSAKTYPWNQEQPGEGNVEPLLLPWGGISSVRYSWDGSQFVRGGS